ncbi:MAG: GIY-YIG nuclease family protein [Cyclobacteriaceae bacterium]
MRAKGGYAYIVANKTRTVLYVGVTNNLHRRISEHKSGSGSVFTGKYNCHDLMYYEFFPTIVEAIHREKRLKKYTRLRKEELIKAFNPEFEDLFDQIEDFQ